MPLPEPWLRGPIDGLHPVAAHLIYTFTQCREEVALHTVGLTDISTVSFHLAHIAGSVNRLTTYLKGEQLSAEQMARLKGEPSTGQNTGATLRQLLEAMDAEFDATEAVVRAIDPGTYPEPRYVGRQQLPTSVGGLIIHLSEHTQRHLGQAILAAKLAR